MYKKHFDYVFLSPIFDSISKAGYKSAFTEEMLKEASDKGIIDEKVVALGGVTFDKIPYLKKLNFGGAAMMGILVGSFLL
jgi:thiamine-phosphate pyrophosphorylase